MDKAVFHVKAYILGSSRVCGIIWFYVKYPLFLVSGVSVSAQPPVKKTADQIEKETPA